MSYQEMAANNSSIPNGFLGKILQNMLLQKQESHPRLGGITSLLGTGVKIISGLRFHKQHLYIAIQECLV